MNTKRPNIFIADRAISSVDDSIDKLKKIGTHIAEYAKLDGVIPAYLYAYAIYEGTLYYLYKAVARAFPDRIEIEYKKAYGSIILESGRMASLLDIICDDFSKKFGHVNFENLITKFGGVVAIKFDAKDFPVKEMNQYKDNRDKLSHRGCTELSIQIEEVHSHLNAAVAVLERIKNSFCHTYSKYTDEYLIRESCKYVFRMGEGDFDKCFFFRDRNFYIKVPEIERWYGSISSSERHLFILFMANFGLGFSKEMKVEDILPTCSLDNNSLNKVSYINELFRAYPHLINTCY